MSNPQTTEPETNRIGLSLAGFGAVVSSLVRMIPFASRLPNLAPVGALSIYTGAKLPLGQAIVPPFAVMAVTDLFLKYTRGWPGFDPWVYVSLFVYIALGRLLARDAGPGRITLAAVLGSTQFFLITNFGYWYTWRGTSLEITDSVAGLLYCYEKGLEMLAGTVVGDLAFTALLFGAHRQLAKSSSPVLAESEAR